jgi:hypothetical protein
VVGSGESFGRNVLEDAATRLFTDRQFQVSLKFQITVKNTSPQPVEVVKTLEQAGE